MGGDTTAAQDASNINSRLMMQYSRAGVGAVSNNLDYIKGSLAQGGLPQYVRNAYSGARGGATDAAASQLEGLRQGISGGGSQNESGSYIGGLTQALPAASASYQGELQKIGTTQALAGLSERNKLLGALSGQGADATNLSAGFGGLTNAGLGIAGNNPGAYPYVVGGLSAATGLYGQYQQGAQGRQNASATAQGNYAASIGAGSWGGS